MTPFAGKDGRQQEKGAAEDEMVRKHQRLCGREFEQVPGDREGQRSLAGLLQSMGTPRVRHDLATEHGQ